MKTSDERINSINDKVKAKRKQRAATIWAASSVACVLLVLTVVCSLPILGDNVPDVNAYKDDEYYPIIEKINALYSDNRYSIFDKFGDSLSNISGFGNADEDMSMPTSPMPDITDTSVGSESNKYEETTLNQVNGVIEGDLLKRSTTHAFYLKDGRTKNNEPCLLLQAYKLDGTNTNLVDEYSICAKDETSFLQYSWRINAEMFLSSDATRLTVIATCFSKQSVTYATVISLDVSNPSEITEVNRVYVSGSYLSSRLVNGKLLVITNFYVRNYYLDGGFKFNNIDYDKKESYIPQCGSTLGGNFISASDIHVPNNCQDIDYTVLAMLDEKSLEVVDSYAVFSYAQDVYVSQDYIVVARNNRYYYAEQFDYGKELSSDKANAITSSKQIMTCEMVALKYGDGIAKIGEVGIEGCIKDRYSMDEKDGVLRVFTTTRHKLNPFYLEDKNSLNVNLYCIDLSSMQTVAVKEQFAPAGDEVKSARFDGDVAYVCTARGTIDPVFYFDLSDLNNITFKDTGEIEGFSDNLIKFNDLLLGIGQGASWNLKIELYRQSDDPEATNGVISVAKFERECRYSSEYKAHFVDAEHNLIGLQVYDYEKDLVTSNPNGSRYKYLLLRYDAEAETLEPVYFEAFDSENDFARAFYDHNGVYVFGSNDFTFIDLSDKR